VILLDPDSSLSIFIPLFLLILHAIFAAAREAIASLRKSRRLQLIEEGYASAQLVDSLAEDATRLLTTEQLVLKFLGFFIVALSAFVFTNPLANLLGVAELTAVIIITVTTVFITLLFGELIPKEIARNFPEPLALWLVHPFRWVSFVATPLARFVTLTGKLLTGRWRDSDDDSLFTAITEDDLRTYVDAAEEDEVLKEDEKEMIYSIFDLSDTLAREIMVPRIDMVAVEADLSPREAIQKIMEAGHSRVPVFVDTIDNIVGILYVKDLLGKWLENGEPTALRGLEREVYYVPETKQVSELLRELQKKRVHIAIVVDEYGGTAGLVTIEDVLEEIVGEIQDEHDAEEFYMQRLSDNEYIFSARMDLDDINDEMSIKLPTDESDTLGGLVYNSLGRIPQAGDVIDGATFDVPDVRLTVLSVDGRRIKTVKLERFTSGENDTDDNQVVPNKGSGLFQNPQNSVSNSS
jgi:CBS domain containing-hemolysin-like protein